MTAVGNSAQGGEDPHTNYLMAKCIFTVFVAIAARSAAVKTRINGGAQRRREKSEFVVQE